MIGFIKVTRVGDSHENYYRIDSIYRMIPKVSLGKNQTKLYLNNEDEVVVEESIREIEEQLWINECDKADALSKFLNRKH